MQNRFEDKKVNTRGGSALFGKATQAKASGIAFSLAAVLPTGLSILLLIVINALGLAKEGYEETQWYLYFFYLVTPMAFFLNGDLVFFVFERVV